MHRLPRAIGADLQCRGEHGIHQTGQRQDGGSSGQSGVARPPRQPGDTQEQCTAAQPEPVVTRGAQRPAVRGHPVWRSQREVPPGWRGGVAQQPRATEHHQGVGTHEQQDGDRGDGQHEQISGPASAGERGAGDDQAGAEGRAHDQGPRHESGQRRSQESREDQAAGAGLIAGHGHHGGKHER